MTYAGYVALNDHEETTRRLHILALVDANRLAPVLGTFECEPAVKQRLSRIVQGLLDDSGESAAATVLGRHLDRIAAKVLASGGVPVFLTYPYQTPAGNVLRQHAAAAEIRYVDVAAGFAAQLGDRKFADYQSPDGHVNDEGYRMMATAVAGGIGDLIAK